MKIIIVYLFAPAQFPSHDLCTGSQTCFSGITGGAQFSTTVNNVTKLVGHLFSDPVKDLSLYNWRVTSNWLSPFSILLTIFEYFSLF